MARTIGIVACSAEGAALCYRTICIEAAAQMGTHAHPTVVLHGHSLADYVACLDRSDLAGVAELMLSSANHLAAAGADFLICPDNTIHQAMAWVTSRSPLPWLDIAEVVAAAAQARGFAKLGITGTRWLVDSAVYPDRLAARGLGYVRPSADDRATVNRIIMDELINNVIRPESTAAVQAVIDRLKGQGCDAVVLGCTELPLIIADQNSSLPTLDSTRLLARAAIRQALV